MSKRRHSGRQRAAFRVEGRVDRPASARSLLQQAVSELRRDRTDEALGRADEALRMAPSPEERATAQQLKAEAHFRAAYGADENVALLHLNDALGCTPDDPRLRFHRAIALWRLDRLSEATADFDAVAQNQADRAGLEFLRQLAGLSSLAAGATAPAPGLTSGQSGLTPKEAQLIQRVRAFVIDSGTEGIERTVVVGGSGGSGGTGGSGIANSAGVIGASGSKGGSHNKGEPGASGGPGNAGGSGRAGGLAKVKSPASGATLDEDDRLWRPLAALQLDLANAPVAELSAAARATGGKRVRGAVLRCVGVAALRAGDADAARAAWVEAQQLGAGTPRLAERLSAVLREVAVARAASSAWQAVVDLLPQAPQPMADSVFVETVAIAFDHLGYQAAQRGNWSLASRHWHEANILVPTRGRAQNLALASEATEDWPAAADAWREMVRRRPRKADHPDYLNDRQVAAIWRRAAEDYDQADDLDQCVTCLRTALKYAPDDLELRLALVDALIDNEQDEAAANEVDRILHDHPDHVPALIRLGVLRRHDPSFDAIGVWRRAWALEPGNPEVRDGLAQAHIAQLNRPSYYFIFGQSLESAVKAALADLPDHPGVLLAVADIWRSRDAPDRAKELYLQAYHAAPNDVVTVDKVLHDLLHLGAEAEVQALLPQVRDLPGLLPAFWVDGGMQVLHCKLGADWATCFFDEAVALAEAKPDRASKASVLVRIYDSLGSSDAERELLARYAGQIRLQVPDSGAVEYVAASEAFFEQVNANKARQLLKTAARKASRAGDDGLLEAISLLEMKVSGISPEKFLSRLMEMFPDGPPDEKDLENLPDEFFADFF